MNEFYRRRLPHWQPEGPTIFVTWHLFGMLPISIRAETFTSDGARFAAQDRHMDSTKTGPMWLQDQRVAAAVADVLLQAESRGLYQLKAWVLMGNHAHMLIKPSRQLWEIMRLIKSASAREANRILARTGQPFWHREYYDHWVRDSREEAKIVRYIENNPVRAGLCGSPEEFMWSSASLRFAKM